jgi:flagellar biosynthetic protein FlhB
VTAALSVFLQTNWNMRDKWIKWQFNYLNPINGVKRIFSLSNAMNIARDVCKLLLILPIAYFALASYAGQMIQLIHMSVTQIMSFMATAAYDIFWKIAVILIVLSIVDYVWGRFQWFKQNKMTKQEVKDERKSLEGDEATKRKIQSKGLQRIMQRIQQSVPQADVIITNPTHYAVALKYDRNTMNAPKVIAKGKGHLALRIREIAKESGVPILERKPLARALYASCEVGSEIPRELFKAVARVLAYVYKLKPRKKKRVKG